MLRPFGLPAVFTVWQFAPIVTAAVVILAGLYLWGVVRVAHRHPARRWPVWKTGMFLGGLAVVVLATESGIGSYDNVLFWDHMVQHLMLIMVAPPLLIFGQPITLLMHASRNPLHTWVKRILRSRIASFLTWPVFGCVAYTVAVIWAHLTNFANLVQTNQLAHNAEHVLFLVVGYLFFLPILGREPIRWRLSYPVRFVILVLVMPVDTFTGLMLGYGSAGHARGSLGTAAVVGAAARVRPAQWWSGDVDRRRRHHVRPDDARVHDVEPRRPGGDERPRVARGGPQGQSRQPGCLTSGAARNGRRWHRLRRGRRWRAGASGRQLGRPARDRR